jgi:nucleotide-binding universal stress UspA family protein
MISTVAVGTDGSKTAAAAVAAAFDLAERYGARLVVISASSPVAREAGAVRLSGATSPHPSWEANEAEQVERVLAAAEESAAERGIECRSAMAPGDPAEVIVNLAEQHHADLLVVGNKGMERRVLGSVPNSVSHKATCSVLVVKTS